MFTEDGLSSECGRDTYTLLHSFCSTDALLLLRNSLLLPADDVVEELVLRLEVLLM